MAARRSASIHGMNYNSLAIVLSYGPFLAVTYQGEVDSAAERGRNDVYGTN